MNDTPADLARAHHWFAVHFNNEAWDLAEEPQRTPAQDERLLAAAYAAYRHWLEVGSALNEQRARHLLATAHARLGQHALALQHARACLHLSQTGGSDQTPFDRACALECLARAEAAAGQIDQAQRLRADARRAGERIASADERLYFERLLGAGPWHGLESTDRDQ